MKTELQDMQTTILEPSKSDLQSNSSLTKCIQQKDGYYVCINKTCKSKNAILCQEKACQCIQQHNLCVKVQIQKLVATLNQQAYSFTKIQHQIKDIFKNIIDKLSSMEQEILLKYQQLFNTHAYSPQEKQFLTSLNAQNQNKIKSKSIYQLYSKIYDRQSTQKTILQISKKLQNISTKLTQQVDFFQTKLKEKLLQLQNIYTDKQKQTVYCLFQESKIITKIQDQKTLIEFFPQCLINTQLLYRASEQNFDKMIFHKFCDDIQNILILIQTSENKIIGGYTPIAFSSKERRTWMYDENKKSFIFSLTQKDKFSLVTQQQSIWNGSLDEEFICGFGDNLQIVDKANINKGSIVDFSQRYINQKYQNNKQGYVKFTGSSGEIFLIKQWQCWRLSLKEFSKK